MLEMKYFFFFQESDSNTEDNKDWMFQTHPHPPLPVQSPVRSHVLHFYFPAVQLILCCLLCCPEFFLGQLAFRMYDATDGRIGLTGGWGEAFSDFFYGSLM